VGGWIAIFVFVEVSSLFGLVTNRWEEGRGKKEERSKEGVKKGVNKGGWNRVRRKRGVEKGETVREGMRWR
jgi:hypothetical protein